MNSGKNKENKLKTEWVASFSAEQKHTKIKQKENRFCYQKVDSESGF